MTEFSVRAVIRSVLLETDYADPGQVAKEAISRIAESDLPAALEQAMRDMARIAMGNQRAASHTDRPAPGHGVGDAQCMTAGGGASRSRKRDAIRRWHAELHARYSAGGTYKLLADMTRDDLLTAAAERDDLAAANSAKAAELRRWAAVVERNKVGRVGDLKDAALSEMFQPAAA